MGGRRGEGDTMSQRVKKKNSFNRMRSSLRNSVNEGAEGILNEGVNGGLCRGGKLSVMAQQQKEILVQLNPSIRLGEREATAQTRIRGKAIRGKKIKKG